MLIECVTSGPVDTNGYLVADEAQGEAMVVDAPLESAAALLGHKADVGLMALGLGFMFISGKVLPWPVPSGIAGGIALAVGGFVVLVVEALRD